MKKQTTFFKKVHKLTRSIPKGKVATYGQLARMAGSPSAARAVGTCMRCNTSPSVTPCHRVVASDGSLSGYAFGGTAAKKKMLMKEGVKFTGQRVDLVTCQWKKS